MSQFEIKHISFHPNQTLSPPTYTTTLYIVDIALLKPLTLTQQLSIFSPHNPFFASRNSNKVGLRGGRAVILANDLPAGVFSGRAAIKAVDPQYLADPASLMVAAEASGGGFWATALGQSLGMFFRRERWPGLEITRFFGIGTVIGSPMCRSSVTSILPIHKRRWLN